MKIDLVSEAAVRRYAVIISPRGFANHATKVMFNPVWPHLLYASFRRHNKIYCWDLRGDTSKALFVLNRNARSYKPTSEETNQKTRFDIDLSGCYLAVGDQVSVFFYD